MILERSVVDHVAIDLMSGVESRRTETRESNRIHFEVSVVTQTHLQLPTN